MPSQPTRPLNPLCVSPRFQISPGLRRVFTPLAVTCCVLLLSTQSHAQTQTQTPSASAWPTKPVKIMVTFPPGGAPDTLARILADKWGQTLGQTFTVDNKPGAGATSALTLWPRARAMAPAC